MLAKSSSVPNGVYVKFGILCPIKSKVKILRNSKIIHEFVYSILRLVSNINTFQTIISKWRPFSFQPILSRLFSFPDEYDRTVSVIKWKFAAITSAA